MTNYQKWETWDPKVASEQVDENAEKESLFSQAKKDEKRLLDNLGSMEHQSKKVADALRSKAAVIALKAKGAMGGRQNRNRSRGIVKSSPSSTLDSSGVMSLQVIACNFCSFLRTYICFVNCGCV